MMSCAGFMVGEKERQGRLDPANPFPEAHAVAIQHPDHSKGFRGGLQIADEFPALLFIRVFLQHATIRRRIELQHRNPHKRNTLRSPDGGKITVFDFH